MGRERSDIASVFEAFREPHSGHTALHMLTPADSLFIPTVASLDLPHLVFYCSIQPCRQLPWQLAYRMRRMQLGVLTGMNAARRSSPRSLPASQLLNRDYPDNYYRPSAVQTSANSLQSIFDCLPSAALPLDRASFSV